MPAKKRNGVAQKGVTVSSNLRLVQINLHHANLPTENLLIFMKSNDIDISLIQEPWVNKGKVKGLLNSTFNVFYKVMDEDSNISWKLTPKIVKVNTERLGSSRNFHLKI